jgi:uncharacterized membrane protein YhhN
MAPFLLATLLAVGCLLIAEHRGSRPGVWIWKPLASSAFVATAIAGGASASAYGQVVLAALCLSWLGDVLLIPDDPLAFRAGILAFLLGHVAFLCAFLVRGVELAGCALALVFVVPVGWAAIRWLRPHLSGEMKAQVYAYIAVISLMVVAAAGSVALSPRWTIFVAAVAFFCSDLSVARDRFVHESFVNRAWGLPLYYFAQILFAVSASS